MERGLPPEQRRGVVRLLLGLGLGVAALSAVFGVTILRNHHTFRDYRVETLDDPERPPRWATEEVGVEDCVVEAVRWGMLCPGIASWCLAEVPVVAGRCLASQDRRDYCEAVGDEVMSTRFGFGDCEALRSPLDDEREKYAKRANKKYCAASYRAVAEHCLELRGRR